MTTTRDRSKDAQRQLDLITRRKAQGRCIKCERSNNGTVWCVVHHQRVVAGRAARNQAGLCASAGCPNLKQEDRTLCEGHLIRLRETAKARRRAKKEAGKCRQCDRPAFAGMAYCLVHRKGTNLPWVVRAGLRAYRDAEKKCHQQELAAWIVPHLSMLNFREQEILIVRLGLNGSPNTKTLEEVGDRFGVSRERTRQLQQNALAKIQAATGGDMLTIQKGVPIPVRIPTGAYAETLQAMEAGDSVLASNTEKCGLVHVAKKLGCLVVSRRVDDKQYRVWLVSKAPENGRPEVTLESAP